MEDHYSIRVVAPHFVAGFVVKNEKVVEAAPILNYLVGKSELFARNYLALKKWGFSVHDAPSSSEQLSPESNQPLNEFFKHDKKVKTPSKKEKDHSDQSTGDPLNS